MVTSTALTTKRFKINLRSYHRVVYTRVVTEFAKIRDISDSDIFRSSIISRPPFHADHFGLNGIENKSVSPINGSV